MTRLRLLLVDDDEVDRLALRRGLARAGLEAEVTEAGSTEEALTLLGEAGRGPFDLACIDFHLPGEDGLTLLCALKRWDEALPVIVMTGQGSEERAVELMKAGASDYLVKGTVSPMRLGQSVKQALALAHQTRRRRAAEEALVRLATHLPDTVVRFDADGRHVHMNRVPPWAGRASVSELLGRRLSELPAELALAPLGDALAAALAGEAKTMVLEVSPPSAPGGDGGDGEDGEDDRPAPARTTYEVRLVPEPADESGPTALALVRDVSAERAQKREEARRSEFERQLMGIVSHDLKSPIAALSMVAEILERELPDKGPRVARALELLAASSQRARRLVTDILDFTRARLGGGIPMARRPTDLGVLADEIAAEVRLAHPGRELVVTRSGDLSGRFDPDRLAQVLTNLLTNALDHGNADSPVSMRLEGREREVAIAVTNRGDTLGPEVLARIFEPFEQAGDPPTRGSVGLGLFIVRHIVEAHRGRIVVSSSEGETTFAVTLPRRAVTSTHRAITLSEIAPVRPPSDG